MGLNSIDKIKQHFKMLDKKKVILSELTVSSSDNTMNSNISSRDKKSAGQSCCMNWNQFRSTLNLNLLERNKNKKSSIYAPLNQSTFQPPTASHPKWTDKLIPLPTQSDFPPPSLALKETIIFTSHVSPLNATIFSTLHRLMPIIHWEANCRAK
jgi:hypothetical protein